MRASTRRRVVRAALIVLGVAGAAAAAIVALWARLPDPARLARENPRTTALIAQRASEARARRHAFHPRQAWVPLERISPRLVDAVLLSEDAGFWGHEGIDWDATWEAAAADWKARRFARGASTITQQLAKNLWLGTEKSLARKAEEAVLAVKLERTLPKRRILALYLNVAEWGDGVFGAEAGARARFGVSAAELSPAQAAVMASMLPAPRRVDLASPSTWLKRRARRLLDRMQQVGRLDPADHRHASAELERILAGPAPDDDVVEEPPEDEALVEPGGDRPEGTPARASPSATATATPIPTATATPTATPIPTATPTPTPIPVEPSGPADGDRDASPR